MPSIVVDDAGTELSYIDSGPPAPLAPGQGYLTMISINGMSFTGHVFEPMMRVASKAGVRFVSINRRDYPGSTPLTVEDNRVLSSGSEDEKELFLRARGIEVANFIDRFIEEKQLPPPLEGGRDGGVVLIGWSLGCAFVFSALANVDALPGAVKSRLTAYLRAFIMYEPPTVALGSPRPPQLWSPLIDTTLPEKARVAATTPFLTGYFDHGNLSTRDVEVLSYYVPSLSRVPTIYNLSDEERARAVWEDPSDKSDMLFMFFCEPQIRAAYKKACFDPSVRAQFPRLKFTNIMGTRTSPHGIPAFWSMEDDNEQHGGECVAFKVIPGGNHFMQWDEPDLLFNACIECL
ncbi:hypothetical protein C8Q78DRAFT_984275 [Trametes maxima]|nr:hypothetical protein C8Q78DRAFT_984275 [Trametes maxima]